MEYQSTRNGAVKVSSAQAIKQGISPDGGLYVPVSIPVVGEDEIEKMSHMNYVQRAEHILSKYLTDYSLREIAECAENAYTAEKFGSDDIAPLHKITESAYVLELWHGPTCAFKDMALQILPHLLTKAIKKTGDGRCVAILVATSGDTGKAALEGFRDVEGTKIQVFYPSKGVSQIQMLQMNTQEGANVSVIAVNGNFDDAQTGVKRIFTDEKFAEELDGRGYALSSANSINWGRLVPQIVYYFSAYCDMLKGGEIKNGEKINICVPTGNFGNILAAYYAKEMGLPVKKLICASNRNSVLTDFIKTGTYNKNRTFYTTISPSMDIIISSNLERLLFIMSNRCDSEIKDYMQKLSTDGEYTVSDKIFDKIKNDFYAGCCNDDETKAQIGEINKKYSYTVDTHTAVELKVYKDYAENTGDKTKTVIASTANPFKFNKSVLEALGRAESDGMSEFELLDMLSEASGMQIPTSLASLKNKTVRFTDVCDKNDMKKFTSAFLS